jgi:hypothetical protein
MPLKVLYENDWVRVYDHEGVLYRDSKYRTYDCARSAGDFIQAWRTGNLDLRTDLTAAFGFFPADDGAETILHVVATIDPVQAGDLRELRRKPPSNDELLKALFEEAGNAGEIPGRLIGENRWFRAYLNRGGFFFDNVRSTGLTLTFEEYRTLQQTATSHEYRDAINAFFALPRGRKADQDTFAKVYGSAN